MKKTYLLTNSYQKYKVNLRLTKIVIYLKKSKLIYIGNRVKKRALYHLKSYHQLNFITFYTTIDDLFNFLKDIFDNSD